MMKNIVKYIAFLGAISILLTSCAKTVQKTSRETVKLDFLVCWQGGSGIEPGLSGEDVVGKKILENTNVQINFQFITTSEVEKLNVMFASGEMADVVSAPFWGGSDGATLLIKKAAKEGLITPLDKYIEEYGGNIKHAFKQNLYSAFISKDLEDSAFEGNHYFIPTQITASPDDAKVDPKMLFIREDIFKALNINRDEIKDHNDVYNLLKRIADGNFKDVNGQNVIPAGNWHNGYLNDLFFTSLRDSSMGFTGYYKGDDGVIADDFFSPEQDETSKYMRKLLSEGLYDVEAFTQNAARADEKVAKGAIAVMPATYSMLKDKLSASLYASNPEMRYVPLNVLEDKKGEKVTYQLNGSSGTPIIFIPKNNNEEKNIAVIKVMNYLNSDEGRLLMDYGVEGQHYKLVDGKPRCLPEVLKAFKADYKTLTKQGIRSLYSQFCIRNDKLTRYGEEQLGDSEIVDENYNFALSFMPKRVYKDGKLVNYYEDEYPQMDVIRAAKSDSKIMETINRSYFAKSDEEALSILNGYRDQLLKSGIKGLFNFINEKVKGQNDLLY